ncbi:MAG: DUF3667 domain-containing protein [Bacteroidetes bacterium]|nr:DUF3667 domain-containing protein [Bacteroidota bacterium]
MTVICKNCGRHFNGNFCNYCGQTAETHKIDAHFLWHDIQHGLFHFDHGILYTIKQLFTRPGNAIKEFIEGKRVKYFKPISLVILLATVYGLLSHTFQTDFAKALVIKDSPHEKIVIEKINEWISGHFSWATLLTLPFYTIGSFIAFRKQGYNFAEHFVMNTFLASQRIVLHILIFPLSYFFYGTPSYNIFSSVIPLLEFILVAWGYSQFFNKLTITKSFLLTLLSYAIVIVLGGIIGTTILHLF